MLDSKKYVSTEVYGSRFLQVEGHRGNGFHHVSVCAAVGRLGTVRVDAVYGHVNELHHVLPVTHGHFDDCVKGNLDVGELVEGALGEVGHDATDDRLVGDDQQVFRFIHFREDFSQTSKMEEKQFSK